MNPALAALGALLLKELRQLLRNRQVIGLLLVPPFFQLVIFGIILNPDVRAIPLGIVDESRSATSREIVSALTRGGTFVVGLQTPSEATLADSVRRGKLAAGIVIPPDLERRIATGEQPRVGLFLDGVNSYTSGLAGGYAAQILARVPVSKDPPASNAAAPKVTYLYNPGLVSSWFFIPGIIGALLLLVSVIATAVEAIREKETGTLEQLLMTPASSSAIVAAKILPMFCMLLVTYAIAVCVAYFGFGLPFRGSFIAFTLISALMILGGMALGMLIATLARNRRQAILSAMFLALPLVQLSGALAPIESMPPAIATATLLNPLRHYAAIVREIWLKGAGIDVYWPSALFLAVFTLAALWISIALYRRQLV
jgi:ABC-2 type transport system permease protein